MNYVSLKHNDQMCLTHAQMEHLMHVCINIFLQALIKWGMTMKTPSTIPGGLNLHQVELLFCRAQFPSALVHEESLAHHQMGMITAGLSLTNSQVFVSFLEEEHQKVGFG